MRPRHAAASTRGVPAGTGIHDLPTPCLLLDRSRVDANLARMRARALELGVALRPHMKTCKSAAVARSAMGAGGSPWGGITVSTLAEAAYFLEAGFDDILYAVGIAPDKLPIATALMARGADLKIILDSPEAAMAVDQAGLDAGVVFRVMLELDCDGHRAGLDPDDPALLETGEILARGRGCALEGVMTHAGGSYGCSGREQLEAMAERERSVAVAAAVALRGAGLPCGVVSVGSTPTAMSARGLDGVTEMRPGAYMFNDLMLERLGVCALEDLALCTLVSVIGRRPDTGRLITDGGWTSLSRDRGHGETGYGLVLDAEGGPMDGRVTVLETTQEHGVLARSDGRPLDLPVGTKLRVLPNHACATGACHDVYHVLGPDGRVEAVWDRCGGWYP